MRAALFTREFPPHIYGGAGVHVDYLSRELAKKIRRTGRVRRYGIFREGGPACARFTHGSVGAATTSFGFLHVIFSIGRPVSLFAELTFK